MPFGPSAALNTVTVTVRRPGGTDRYGDTTWASIHEVEGCIVAPTSGDSGRAASRELTGLRDTVITGYTVYAPHGADVLAIDQVRLPDDPTWWEVDGEVADWSSAFSGWQPGTVVSLRRVRG